MFSSRDVRSWYVICGILFPVNMSWSQSNSSRTSLSFLDKNVPKRETFWRLLAIQNMHSSASDLDMFLVFVGKLHAIQNFPEIALYCTPLLAIICISYFLLLEGWWVKSNSSTGHPKDKLGHESSHFRFLWINFELPYRLSVIKSHYCWSSHDVTKIQTTKLSILLRFYLHDVLELLKNKFFSQIFASKGF